jgi:site-specific DNA-adenine methylase
MKYMGSKARFTKDILPIILENRLPNQHFVDLFTGGANVVSLVEGNRIANDKNKHLIEMFKAMDDGLIGWEGNHCNFYWDESRDKRIRDNIIEFFKAHPDGIIEFG